MKEVTSKIVRHNPVDLVMEWKIHRALLCQHPAHLHQSLLSQPQRESTHHDTVEAELAKTAIIGAGRSSPSVGIFQETDFIL